MPGIGFGDWGEMTTVPHVLGVAHPTGYPTYIVLAWLAELVPIGSIAFRANLLSAVYVALTLATLSLISLRLGVRPLLAVVGAIDRRPDRDRLDRRRRVRGEPTPPPVRGPDRSTGPWSGPTGGEPGTS